MGSGAAKSKEYLPHRIYVNDYLWGSQVNWDDFEASNVVTGFYKCKGDRLHNYVIITTDYEAIILHYCSKSSIICRHYPEGMNIHYSKNYRVRGNYRLIDLFRLCEWIVRNKRFSYTGFNCRAFIRLLRWNICSC